jgi:hypothetical protein
MNQRLILGINTMFQNNNSCLCIRDDQLEDSLIGQVNGHQSILHHYKPL